MYLVLVFIIFYVTYFRESRRKDFEFDRGENERYRNYDRFKGSGNYDRRRNDTYRTQEEPEWMTGNSFLSSKYYFVPFFNNIFKFLNIIF